MAAKQLSGFVRTFIATGAFFWTGKQPVQGQINRYRVIVAYQHK